MLPHVLRRSAVTIVLLAPCTGYAQGTQPLEPDGRDLVGCYRFAASRIALDSVPAIPGMLTPPPGARQAWSYWQHVGNAYWRTLGGDTIEVVVGNSLHGWRFLGVAEGRDLVGRLLPWTDIAGVRFPRLEVEIRRESCAVAGSGDGSPPNGDVLFDSVPAVVASFIRDSVLARFPEGWPIAARYTSNPHSFSARVARLLAIPAPDSSVIYFSSVHAENFGLERDRFSVAIVTGTCTENPDRNYRSSRMVVEFQRDGSRWRLNDTIAVERVFGVCGPRLGQTSSTNRSPATLLRGSHDSVATAGQGVNRPPDHLSPLLTRFAVPVVYTLLGDFVKTVRGKPERLAAYNNPEEVVVREPEVVAAD